jgi:hypothetical protein
MASTIRAAAAKVAGEFFGYEELEHEPASAADGQGHGEISPRIRGIRARPSKTKPRKVCGVLPVGASDSGGIGGDRGPLSQRAF